MHDLIEMLETRLFMSAAPSSSPPPSPSPRELTVMTQNLYVGVDVTRVVGAQSLAQLPEVVRGMWETVKQTDFPARAQTIADEIAATRPDVVGLQEAALWRTQAGGDFWFGNRTPATNVEYDFVQILVDALAERGLQYRAAAVVENADFELPTALPLTPGGMDVRVTDRDVILARADVPASQLKIVGAASGHFATNLQVGPLVVRRGWTAVDAKVRGVTVRVVNTHADPTSLAVQIAQIGELLAGPANTALPTVLLGDLNSDAAAGEPGYLLLRAAGFGDAWIDTHGTGGDPGLTSGHDEDLRDFPAKFDKRIDFVLYRAGAGAGGGGGGGGGAGVVATEAMVIDQPLPFSAAGPLWTSDHAGVVATLAIGGRVGRGGAADFTVGGTMIGDDAPKNAPARRLVDVLPA